MSDSKTAIRCCNNLECLFRFPGPEESPFLCPKCRAVTSVVIADVEQHRREPMVQPISKTTLDIGLDNLRSVLNVGSIFRTADAVGINHIHLFGISPLPTHPQMKKTALGADTLIPWSYHPNSLSSILDWKTGGGEVWSLERTWKSVDIFSVAYSAIPTRLMLVVGNENSGVDPGILAFSERIIHLPMIGTKESLNVANAFTAATYWLKFGSKGNNE